MSRRTMPYHRRYHQDALQGYRVLSLEERGAYTTILDLIYDAGGPIDNNERWLAGELNCSIRKVRVLLAALVYRQKLYITGRGKISNHRAEAELENTLKISRKRAENATKREGKNSENTKNDNKNNEARKQMFRKCAVIPEPEPYNRISTVEYDAEEPGGSEGIRPPEPVPISTIPHHGQIGNSDRLLQALDRNSPGRLRMYDMLSRRAAGRSH